MKEKHTLAEIEAYLRKAARAAGLDWGLAEEAGKAARWLAAFDLPGAEITLAHLQQLDGNEEIVDRIEPLDTIEEVTIWDGFNSPYREP